MESCEKRKGSRLNSLKDSDFILLVGEGDFSFAAFLAQHTKAHIVATTLLPLSHILNERQKKNISLIEKFGGSVYADVDATRLVSHVQVNKNAYKVIIFNFPHIPGKMKISANRDLLRNFFISAKKVLESEGEVHVTLCKGQGGTAAEVSHREWQNTWQITSMAAVSDFVLDHVEPFHAEDHPSYRCSGYRGLEKSFHIDGALTHVFKLGHHIVRTLETVFTGQQLSNTADKRHNFVSTHIETCKQYKSLFETCDHPVAKTLLSIINEFRECSTNCQVISFRELLVCSGKICFRHWRKCFSVTKGLPCSISSLLSSGSCIFQDVERQLNKGTDVIIISSHVCCPQNLPAAELPLSCSSLFLGRSASRVIDKIYEVLSRFLCKQNSSDIIDDGDDDFYAVGLPEDLCSHQSIVKEGVLFKSLDNEDLAHFSYVQKENNIKFEEIGTVLASFNIIQASSQALFQDVRVIISGRNLKYKGTHQEVLKLGNVYAVTYNESFMFCTSLEIECVSMVKFHIFNHQILLSDIAYFASHVREGELHVVYRSPSLFPPSYVHDTSFWVSEEFEENQLILLVKAVVGDLLCDVRLIDTYCEKSSLKKSCCYRLIYQSCDRPLSKDKARDIHTNLVRCCIEQYLNVKLR